MHKSITNSLLSFLLFSGTVSQAVRAAETRPLPPQRVVSLAPNFTDLLLSLGLGPRLVGVTRFCNVSTLPHPPVRVGDLSRWNLEQILSLQPDLLLVAESGSIKRQAGFLQALNLRVVSHPLESIRDLLRAVHWIGKEFQVTPETDRLEEAIFRSMGEASRVERRRALLLVSTEPIFASTQNSYEGDLLEHSGWTSALGSGTPRRKKLGLEEVFALDPDAVILASHEADAKLPPTLEGLRAVRAGRVYTVPANDVVRPGPGVVPALQRLRELRTNLP